LIKAFEETKDFLILGHEEPDGDCVGSQMALTLFLRRMGKNVEAINKGPFKKPEIKKYESSFHATIEPLQKSSKPLVVILDCSTPDRLGESISSKISGLKTMVIDHHATGSEFGDIRYVDSKAVSTTLLIYRIMLALEEKPDRMEAEFLLLGLCTDTGFFRHLEGGNGEALRLAADLSDVGCSLKSVHAHLNGGKLLENQKLMGLVLSRTETYWDNKVLVSWEAQDDRSRLGAENRESDSIYQTLQGVVGNEVVILLRAESEGKTSVGLRSRNLVDVAQLAKDFGGGGHIRASGFMAEIPMLALKKQLLKKLEVHFIN